MKRKDLMEKGMLVPEVIGRSSINYVNSIGRSGVLLFEAIVQIFLPPFRWKLYFKQLEFIGNKSLFVVLLTGLFTGMVLTLQTFYALKTFSSESIVGGIVALSMTRELGPVLTSLMVNARAGSAIAAQIGTMKVTEQIAALDSMAVNSIQYIVSPRIFAGFFILPFLTMISDIIGVVGGYLVGVVLLGVDSGIFIAKVIDFVELWDIVSGLIKSSVFGLILSFVGCYKGYYTTGGAEGVGNATTQAVVNSSVLILMTDYIMGTFLLN